MPLKKLLLKPGVNRENTRYTTEGGWYDCDKIRFRQGTPEKIGGWQRISLQTFLGVCRSLNNWVTLSNANLIGLGTNLKFYIEEGGGYNDITPIRLTTAAGDVTFAATSGSASIVVTDTAHGATTNDFVTFSDAVSLGGDITDTVLNKEYQITDIVDANSYTITATATANASDTGNGGAVTVGAYQINTGPAVVVPFIGWGAGTWGVGTWGVGESADDSLRIWSQANFGEDLIYGPRGGEIYYWDATGGVTARGVLLSSLAGATDVPTHQNLLLTSDISRFVFAFGASEYGSATVDPMLIRWSDQEDAINWTPAATNQAGFLRLSNGSEIVTAAQSRQEVLVWTNAALYSLQYQGAPIVWGAQLVGENISIAGQNAVAYANGVSYWMGKDKFYMYDGRVQSLRCDLRQYVFGDLNTTQYEQVTSGTNEGYNEIWWFYCSANSFENDRYVIYNYREDVWYFGTLGRTAWLDSGLRNYPLAATYANNLVDHESGVDDGISSTPVPIAAYITSSEFDLDDGHQIVFVWRVLPDMTFRGSTTANPSATMTLLPLKNSGSGYNDPASVGGSNSAGVTRTVAVPVEEFTGQVYTRVRGRQMAMKIESVDLGVTWQLGSPRVDMRPDGRR